MCVFVLTTMDLTPLCFVGLHVLGCLRRIRARLPYDSSGCIAVSLSFLALTEIPIGTASGYLRGELAGECVSPIDHGLFSADLITSYVNIADFPRRFCPIGCVNHASGLPS